MISGWCFNTYVMYSVLFQSAGSTLEPSTATIIVGVIQAVATFVSTLVVDRLGRRILLLLSDFVMAICTLLLGIYFYLKDEDSDISSLGWLPLTSVCLFIVTFSLGYGPIPWMMVGELFAPQIKGFASSLSCVLNWILAFIVTRFYSNLADSFSIQATFWIFAVISAIGTVFVFFVVPETKGKTLDQIQKELGGSAPAPAAATADLPKY
jgi:SP family facilitated glucose transporter-like MFS transporter 8